MDYDFVLDASYLKCPLPLLKAKKQLAEMRPGEKLHVIATDADARKDFLLYAQHVSSVQVGNLWQEDDVLHIVLVKQ